MKQLINQQFLFLAILAIFIGIFIILFFIKRKFYSKTIMIIRSSFFLAFLVFFIIQSNIVKLPPMLYDYFTHDYIISFGQINNCVVNAFQSYIVINSIKYRSSVDDTDKYNIGDKVEFTYGKASKCIVEIKKTN